MKRDMDLAREILSKVEEAPYSGSPLRSFEVENHDSDNVNYHIMLLHEAGLLVALELGESDLWFPIRLTWRGHEFLESTRDATVWERAKRIVSEKTGGLTFAILQQVLNDLASKAISGT